MKIIARKIVRYRKLKPRLDGIIFTRHTVRALVFQKHIINFLAEFIKFNNISPYFYMVDTCIHCCLCVPLPEKG